MSFATQNLAPINTADADFRAWGSAISAQLAAMGLIQTTDTGQINWTTVLTPSATNQSRGYEIWRFNDSLQATAPIFIKVEYGSGGATLSPDVWITVGVATNGAGTLTGNTTTRHQLGLGTTTASSATLFACYFSGANNRITVGLFVGSAIAAHFKIFSVERVRDENGAETSDAFYFGGYGINSGSARFVSQVLTQSGTVPAQQDTNTNVVPFAALGVTNDLYGTDVGLSYFFPQKGRLLPPAMGTLLYDSARISGGVTFTTTYYGASHTYLTTFHSFLALSGAFAMQLAMRYE